MKKTLTLALLITFFSIHAFAKKIMAPGYFVNNAGDTINVTFEVPMIGLLTSNIDFHTLQYGIMFVNKDGFKEPLIADSAKVVFLRTTKGDLTFHSKNNNFQDDISQGIFLGNFSFSRSGTIPSKIFLLNHYNNYMKVYEHYFYQRTTSYNASGGTTTRKTLYNETLLQKGDGGYFVVDALFFRKNMTSYVADYPELAQKVAKKIYRYEDLNTIASEYSEWKLKQMGQNK